MKSGRAIFFLFLIILIGCGVYFYWFSDVQEPGCPLEGSAKSYNVQQLNKLKNRKAIVGENDIDRNVALAKMLEPGDDRERWSTDQGAEVIAYVADVKVGGVETCNCKAEDPADRDTHI